MKRVRAPKMAPTIARAVDAARRFARSARDRSGALRGALSDAEISLYGRPSPGAREAILLELAEGICRTAGADLGRRDLKDPAGVVLGAATALRLLCGPLRRASLAKQAASKAAKAPKGGPSAPKRTPSKTKGRK